ncbi:MAG: hypothetical protein VX642_04520 [Bdellovibrionota bacterium]|nr:hypothetical protein [Bdellovibrionota bacterium]
MRTILFILLYFSSSAYADNNFSCLDIADTIDIHNSRLHLHSNDPQLLGIPIMPREVEQDASYLVNFLMDIAEEFAELELPVNEELISKYLSFYSLETRLSKSILMKVSRNPTSGREELYEFIKKDLKDIQENICL